MKQVLVAVLVALAFLQPVRAHAEAQETEENHSTNSELGLEYSTCRTELTFVTLYG